MTTTSAPSDNPFVDPATSFDDAGRGNSFAANATLALGRNVSLTLGTDSLIVLDEENEQRAGSNCCGLWPSGTANTRAIPFYNVLWAELKDSELTLQYASPVSKKVVRAATLKYPVEYQMVEFVNKWIYRLLDRSYGESQRRKRVKVLVNPHSGKGSAEKWYHRDAEPLLKAANCTIDMVKTTYRGEAVLISEKLDIEAFDVIASVSGDGLPHEVFNGLGKRTDAKKALSKIAVVNIPGGSGNAMSCNLTGTDSPSLATLAIIKGIPTPLDLISITQGDTRTLSFLSQSVGIVAESDLATEHLRFLGGQRFTYGFLVRLINKTVYPCDIAIKVAIDDKQAIREHYKREQSNFEPASERRGYRSHHLLEDDASASTGSGSNDDSLPPLRYGTINDKLPDGWELVPYDKLGNFYCGNMAYMAADANFFSPALPNDGFMDLVCINGDISRLHAMKMMFAVENGNFFDMPGVWYRKILGYRIIPKNQEDGFISIDGERVPFQPFQAEVHKGLGTVLSKSGHMYEAPGPI
ncbi:ATP-NAD kinase-like domain-containing protein [Leptodontidium sp. 2 PMI_412]|nr:sphingoid long chain base kinase-like protein [Leptodontidium sp. MPI-SDFR-AT-0119]KAH9218488.1 ATP-NAD kinase-like domain-containing protein [Leptodontidium sp. 2 PMI_412]